MKSKLQYLLCMGLISVLGAQAALIPTESNNEKSFGLISLEGAIDQLILVDADSNVELYELREGLEIDINQVKDRKLSIRLKTFFDDEPFFMGRNVDFILNGPLQTTRTEYVAPYAVFGDINGNYNGKTFPEGAYSIWVGVDSSPDGHYWDTREINFIIGKVEHKIAGFYQIDSDNDYIGNPVENGAMLDYSDNPMSFEARPGTYKIGSVVLELHGPVSYSATENVEPFTLFGDSEGEFNGQSLPEGNYTLTATPYNETHEKGKEGIPLTINFTVEFNKDSFSIASFANMVAADSGDILETIFVFNKMVIDKKDMATNNVNFVVHSNTPAIKSVYMALQGPVSSFETFVAPSHIQIENVAPYAMFGDVAGAFNGKSLPVGLYRITATPYAGEHASGSAGFGRRFEFEIIDTSFLLKNPVLAADGNAVSLFPNPATGKTILQANNEQRIHKTVVLDIFGKKVREYSGLSNAEKTIDLSGLHKGLYFVQIQTDQEVVTKKLVVK